MFTVFIGTVWNRSKGTMQPEIIQKQPNFVPGEMAPPDLLAKNGDVREG